MSRRRPILLYLPGAEKLAEAIHQILGENYQLIPVMAHYFTDGELKTLLPKGPEFSVGGADTYLIQTPALDSGRSPQDTFMETITALATLTECRALYRTAIIPWYPYGCQDRRRRRENLTARLAADFLTIAGATQVITVDPHNDAIQGFFNRRECIFEGLFASSVLVEWLDQNYQLLSNRGQFILTTVDLGGNKRVRHIGKKYGLTILEGDKEKDYQTDQATAIQINGELDPKTAIIIDDMVRSGSTIFSAIKTLRTKGVEKIIIVATHANLCGNAVPELDRLFKQGVLLKAVFTDSFSVSPDFLQKHPWFIQTTLANLLASTIKALHNEESVGHVYEEEENK